jgi:cyanophycinase
MAAPRYRSIRALLLPLLLTFMTGVPAPSEAAAPLLLVGGGERPREGLFAWARATSGPIVLISWASSEPMATLTALRADFEKAGISPSRLRDAPEFTDLPKDLERFVRETRETVKGAAALFFSGGDQNRLMKAILSLPELRSWIESEFHSGRLGIAGTSAGTAIATVLRFTGEEDLSRLDPHKIDLTAGLDLLKGAIVDQHFVKRSRMNRLVSAILHHPDRVGIGIDEDSALWIPKDSREGFVLGKGAGVLQIRATGPQGWHTELYGFGSALPLQGFGP